MFFMHTEVKVHFSILMLYKVIKQHKEEVYQRELD